MLLKEKEEIHTHICNLSLENTIKEKIHIITINESRKKPKYSLVTETIQCLHFA